MKTYAVLGSFLLLTSAAFAQQKDQVIANQAIAIGPWDIATNSKGGKFDSCAMSRTADDLGISFVRTADGLLLLLDSPKWKLERAKAYTVRLTAGGQSVEAKALAETKNVTITLADRPLNAKLKIANALVVQGEGATLRVPLDKSALALERLEACFERNVREGPETNPFVAPSRKP
ncbi:hypothetical protein [Bradyrhizobium sp. LHD-71]|uniref:hypothetical protein n=1 Tax=Bradyrhizobium sp. LHD-71 TaxID=3072141 RepID=UPI00280CFBC0|nr:hypothetical protein [Bradyrhizobium sp. LHD-71]MDQ8730022.1 hypothetical protein [Bradyrhizobium sp. LHD-71]